MPKHVSRTLAQAENAPLRLRGVARPNYVRCPGLRPGAVTFEERVLPVPSGQPSAELVVAPAEHDSWTFEDAAVAEALQWGLQKAARGEVTYLGSVARALEAREFRPLPPPARR